jgi:hypothetical protein
LFGKLDAASVFDRAVLDRAIELANPHTEQPVVPEHGRRSAEAPYETGYAT